MPTFALLCKVLNSDKHPCSITIALHHITLIHSLGPLLQLFVNVGNPHKLLTQSSLKNKTELQNNYNPVTTAVFLPSGERKADLTWIAKT